MAIWFTSDLHFLDENVAKLRGFSTPFAHDVRIIQYWQTRVQTHDTVYLLGDMTNGKLQNENAMLEAISELPGHKILIAGNHDSVLPYHYDSSDRQRDFHQVFDAIHDHKRISVNGYDALLCHFPYKCHADSAVLMPRSQNLPLLRGHTHVTSKPAKANKPTKVSALSFYVGWDARHKFVAENEIAKWLNDANTRINTTSETV